MKKQRKIGFGLIALSVLFIAMTPIIHKSYIDHCGNGYDMMCAFCLFIISCIGLVSGFVLAQED
jgi:hypothetical protein